MNKWFSGSGFVVYLIRLALYFLGNMKNSTSRVLSLGPLDNYGTRHLWLTIKLIKSVGDQICKHK